VERSKYGFIRTREIDITCSTGASASKESVPYEQSVALRCVRKSFKGGRQFASDLPRWAVPGPRNKLPTSTVRISKARLVVEACPRALVYPSSYDAQSLATLSS